MEYKAKVLDHVEARRDFAIEFLRVTKDGVEEFSTYRRELIVI